MNNFCQECGFDDRRPFQSCPQCGSKRITEMPMPPSDRNRRGTTSVLRPLLLIEPDRIKRVMTWTPFDHVTDKSEGIPLGRTILLSSGPGLGKSFWARQLATVMPHAIYFGYEERLEVISEKFETRPPHVSLSNAPFYAKFLHDCEGINRQIGVVIVDSLQTAQVGMYVYPDDSIELVENPESGSVGSVRRLVMVVDEAMRVVRHLPTWTVVLIAQVTKDEKIAGPRTIEHMVDVVMSLDQVDAGTESEKRFVRITKNRCGPQGIWNV